MVVCVFYDGNSQRHNRKCVFMEKPRIEHATPCLQCRCLTPTPWRLTLETLTNSDDSDEMQHNSAFHQDLQSLLRRIGIMI